jgi:hypothetical protein
VEQVSDVDYIWMHGFHHFQKTDIHRWITVPIAAFCRID